MPPALPAYTADPGLSLARDAALKLDQTYQESRAAERLKMKAAWQQAMDTWALAEARFLEGAVVTSNQDRADMKSIKQAVDAAADAQSLIVAAGRLVGFLARVAGVPLPIG